MPTLSDPSQPARRPRAALYAPPADDGQRWVMAGVEWCERLGYDLCSLVVDPDGGAGPAPATVPPVGAAVRSPTAARNPEQTSPAPGPSR
ncbi:hypothetical protein O7627_09640 [Solwaraspora sp. WMMD1047]|uniref:hypothetical protein n=1 Tax=Solwaraspora sp. WMMD1047 TaxID=3016102 RepID=UPI002415EF46|nr:hypothetical protein [Solwaraspora sp. WMMD1047]MDG4829563.1 hypothetical protein [Solwaraspora sp. WMMD1047]